MDGVSAFSLYLCLRVTQLFYLHAFSPYFSVTEYSLSAKVANRATVTDLRDTPS